MLRQSLVKAVRPALRSTIPSRAAFSTTSKAMAEGDTGAPRGQGDAFTKREKANEDYTIKQREKEKLLELRNKLREQREHLDKLEAHVNEIEKNSGDKKQ